jgi:desulfoferrodoxin (superoxide reductase-like protein)
MVKRKSETKFVSKKCPYCLIYIPLNAKQCPTCKAKVGEVDHLGMAKKHINWLSYLMAIIGLAAFAGYIWWAFFT